MENLDTSKKELLKVRLEKAGIDTSLWGKGLAKTLDHLLAEIEKGEMTLENSPSGELLRKIIVGVVSIFYTSSDGKKYILKEEKQIFKDGRQRKRNFSESIFEKIKCGEDPKSATVRGIKEELGIETEILLEKSAEEKTTEDSISYPGLKTEYTRHKFLCTLRDEQYRPEGYTEEQTDKTTSFIWTEIN